MFDCIAIAEEYFDIQTLVAKCHYRRIVFIKLLCKSIMPSIKILDHEIFLESCIVNEWFLRRFYRTILMCWRRIFYTAVYLGSLVIKESFQWYHYGVITKNRGESLTAEPFLKIALARNGSKHSYVRLCWRVNVSLPSSNVLENSTTYE